MSHIMKNARATRIEHTPTHNDIEIASIAHRALTAVQHTGRFGDRKVFISALWTMVHRLDIETGGALTADWTIEHFKSWLLRGRLLTRDGSEDGVPLVVLARADLVSAMDHIVVAASEIATNGVTFHFVLDPAVAHDVYAPRQQARKTFVPAMRGRVGASRRAAG